MAQYIADASIEKLGFVLNRMKSFISRKASEKKYPMNFYINVLYNYIENVPSDMKKHITSEHYSPKTAMALEKSAIFFIYLQQDGSADISINSLISPKVKNIILEDVFFLIDKVLNNNQIPICALFEELKLFSQLDSSINQ